jgi:EAL domain-containing protein (putative c-di-GMP-specific phosphodiesterase class I)
VHIYREKDEEVARRHGEMRWVTGIQNALEEGRFELARQWIVPVNSAKEEGTHYELLLRMRDENGEVVEPEVFLPAAERYDLSTKIDRWVVHEAFEQLNSDPAHLEQLEWCSINLSGLSLSDDDFLTFVTTEITEHQLPPCKICFEVTESAAIADLSGATRFIDVLRRVGCRFALDDFGSGLSSFTYLKSLPVEYLKIDGIFVKDIVVDPINRELVRAINQVGHVMGKKTIAKLVEDEATLAILRDIGVDYAQGFAIDKPQRVAYTSRRAHGTP